MAGQCLTPAALPPGMYPGTLCTGGCVERTAGLDEYKKLKKLCRTPDRFPLPNIINRINQITVLTFLSSYKTMRKRSMKLVTLNVIYQFWDLMELYHDKYPGLDESRERLDHLNTSSY